MGFVDTAKLFLLAIPSIHFTCILFGAPFIYDFIVTLLFSVWLSLLTVVPISLATNGSIVQILTIFFEQKCSILTEEYSLWSAYGSIFGAWLGAFVIPLDWDRWWQRWPVPCAFGSTIGFLLGLSFVWLRIQFLKRMKSSKIIRNSRKQV